ncbi:hydroxymethylbilane synthase [Lutibacter sp. B2]|nr:hydroxymethylbilane synthase [Lutibacter sp. B2]
MNTTKIRVGSRASELALVQTNWVINELKKFFPAYEYEIIEIKTIGDKILDKTLDKIGGKGLFVKEIEAALLEKKIDFAVHSMKDVPTEMVDELMIGAITKREDVRDILISKNNIDLDQLPQNARIGTSSLRRAAQLLNYRPDLRIEPIRGNIQTRMKKMDTMNLDGVILAAAGINRMGCENKISQHIHNDICTPAVGQGALGIQIRTNDPLIQSMIWKLNDSVTEYAVKAERSFMRELKGGCHVPVGAFAYIENDRVYMNAMIGEIDGKKIIRLKDDCKLEDCEKMGIKMAIEGLTKGGKEILENMERND